MEQRPTRMLLGVGLVLHTLGMLLQGMTFGLKRHVLVSFQAARMAKQSHGLQKPQEGERNVPLGLRLPVLLPGLVVLLPLSTRLTTFTALTARTVILRPPSFLRIRT